MSPFPLAGVLAPILGGRQPLDETIWPDFDRTTSQWEDEGGATTNLHDSVNAGATGDTTYCTLQIVILNSTRILGFGMDDPSGEPTPNQDVEIRVRARYTEPGLTLPNAPQLTLRFDENNTQRAQGSATNLTTSFADYSLFLNTTQINSVTDWTDCEVEMYFDNTMNTGLDEEANFQVSSCRIVFSP